jgi:hypothetical protein
MTSAGSFFLFAVEELRPRIMSRTSLAGGRSGQKNYSFQLRNASKLFCKGEL